MVDFLRSFRSTRVLWPLVYKEPAAYSTGYPADLSGISLSNFGRFHCVQLVALSREREGEEQADRLLAAFLAECEAALGTTTTAVPLTATDDFFLVLARKGS